MKYFFLSFCISILIHAQGQEMSKEHILRAWSNHKAYSMELAQSMPDSLYSYRPSSAQMNFGQQLMHMVGNMNRLGHQYLHTKKLLVEEKEEYTKEYVLSKLSSAYDLIQSGIARMEEEDWSNTHEFFAGPMTGQQIVHLLFDHQTHHRGQLIVYLRLNYIKPPRYRGW